MADVVRKPDVVVVGVGRSGTTNTARIVHDHFGVCLGHIFGHTDDLNSAKNPFGGHPGRECHISIRYTRSMLQGNHTPEDWLRHWHGGHEDHKCKAELRGVKQTYFSALSCEKWIKIKPRLVIRTHRTRELTVNSLHHWRRGGRGVWEQFYDEREGMLQMIVDADDFPFSMVRVEYNEERLSDEALIAQLAPHIERLRR